MEYENIDLSANEVKQHEAVREAMNSATRRAWRYIFFPCKYVFLTEDIQPKTG